VTACGNHLPLLQSRVLAIQHLCLGNWFRYHRCCFLSFIPAAHARCIDSDPQPPVPGPQQKLTDLAGWPPAAHDWYPGPDKLGERAPRSKLYFPMQICNLSGSGPNPLRNPQIQAGWQGRSMPRQAPEFVLSGRTGGI